MNTRNYNPDIHHRHSIRLKNYDYSQNGMYFVSVCAQNKECLFGKIINGKMELNDAGKIIAATWYDLPNHNIGIELDEFIVMPNHVHGIIMIVGAGSKPAQPVECSIQTNQIRAGLEPAPTNIGLPEIVRQLKTFSARKINQLRNNFGVPVWQRNYFEHVIRNEKSLGKIRKYISNNPCNWENDELFVIEQTTGFNRK